MSNGRGWRRLINLWLSITRRAPSDCAYEPVFRAGRVTTVMEPPLGSLWHRCCEEYGWAVVAGVCKVDKACKIEEAFKVAPTFVRSQYTHITLSVLGLILGHQDLEYPGAT